MIWKKTMTSMGYEDFTFTFEGPSPNTNSVEDVNSTGGVHFTIENGYLPTHGDFKEFFKADLTVEELTELRDCINEFLLER